MSFPEPYGNATKTQINIVALIGTAVTISSPIAGVNRTVYVNPATGLWIDLPPTLIQRDGKGNNYVCVESDFDISVAALTFVPDHTADGYLAIPSRKLGTTYLFISSRRSIISLIALNDKTHVTLTVNNGDHLISANGTEVRSLSVILSSFDTYQIKCRWYCRGYANSSSPVSLRYGSYDYWPGSHSLYNTSFTEEAVQINDSPLTFIIPRFGNHSTAVTVCMSSSNMQIQTNGTGSHTYISMDTSEAYMTNQSESCTYYGHGFSTIIPPIQSYTNFYRFLTPSLPNFSHHVAIMIRRLEEGGIRLDNSLPNAREEAVSVDSESYSVLYLNVTSGQHDITHVKPIDKFWGDTVRIQSRW